MWVRIIYIFIFVESNLLNWCRFNLVIRFSSGHSSFRFYFISNNCLLFLFTVFLPVDSIYRNFHWFGCPMEWTDWEKDNQCIDAMEREIISKTLAYKLYCWHIFIDFFIIPSLSFSLLNILGSQIGFHPSKAINEMIFISFSSWEYFRLENVWEFLAANTSRTYNLALFLRFDIFSLFDALNCYWLIKWNMNFDLFIHGPNQMKRKSKTSETKLGENLI